jgi:hypothetical protein
VRIEPKPMIAGPTIDAMKYCGSKPHLRDLFANLPATAMDARTAENVHPAFVEIIKQLSADQAKMIKLAARGYKRAFAFIETYRAWPAQTDRG